MEAGKIKKKERSGKGDCLRLYVAALLELFIDARRLHWFLGKVASGIGLVRRCSSRFVSSTVFGFIALRSVIRAGVRSSRHIELCPLNTQLAKLDVH